MKTVKLGKRPFSDLFGSYGSYYRLSPTQGVKVLYDQKFRAKKSLLRSGAWKLAQEEARLLRRAEPTGIVPKGAKAVLVRLNGFYWAGLVMEHLEGLWWSHRSTVDSQGRCVPDGELSVTKYINRKLKSVGLKHLDASNNHLVTAWLKVKVIDFSPDFIKILKDIK